MRSSLPRYLVLVLLIGSPIVAAEPAEPFWRTIVQAPIVRAAAQRLEAAQERVGAAGQLPDPTIEGMTGRMDAPMGETSTMYEVMVRQPLPKRGERAADRDRARAAVSMAEAELAVMAGDVAADVAMALAEAEGAQQRTRLLEAQLQRLQAVLRSLDVQLATRSSGRLADRLTVQTRIASWQLMIAEAQRMREDAMAQAHGRLGLPPAAPLPDYAAPTIREIDPAQAAEIRLAAARADEAAAMLRMAQASGRPMTAVGLRFERERMSMGDRDTIGLAFMSEIPWRGRRIARAESRAALAEQNAAETDAATVRYRIQSTLTRVEQAQRLADLARRLSEETLDRLDAEYDSLARSSGVAATDGSTVLQTVEILEKATEAELQVIAADTAVRVARAELWRYAAPEHFLEPTLSSP